MHSAGNDLLFIFFSFCRSYRIVAVSGKVVSDVFSLLPKRRKLYLLRNDRRIHLPVSSVAKDAQDHENE